MLGDLQARSMGRFTGRRTAACITTRRLKRLSLSREIEVHGMHRGPLVCADLEVRGVGLRDHTTPSPSPSPPPLPTTIATDHHLPRTTHHCRHPPRSQGHQGRYLLTGSVDCSISLFDLDAREADAHDGASADGMRLSKAEEEERRTAKRGLAWPDPRVVRPLSHLKRGAGGARRSGGGGGDRDGGYGGANASQPSANWTPSGHGVGHTFALASIQWYPVDTVRGD